MPRAACWTFFLSWIAALSSATAAGADDAPPLRVGIIGLDTSHVIAFSEVLNDPNAAADVAGCRVVAAYPQGSPDIKSSVERVPKYTEDIRKLGVEIVDGIDPLLARVDAVLLETNDGRPHLAQALPVLRAGKPCFIDKPVAGSLADAVAIYAAAEKYAAPVFTSSSLRYVPGAQKLRAGELGEVFGCDAYGPCPLEATHPDLFWYGIHAVESLVTVLGPDCQRVARTSTADADLVVGVWSGGRIGTFRGMRKGATGYGGTAFTAKGTVPLGDYSGYRPLVVEIVKFFRTRQPPVSASESLAIYALMEAADESKRRQGASVELAEVLAKARRDAGVDAR